jgi:membrane protein required for colicin V production
LLRSGFQPARALKSAQLLQIATRSLYLRLLGLAVRASIMNLFDIIVSAALFAALIYGYRAGLVRSLLTILGYVIAAPLAILITSALGGSTAPAIGAFVPQQSIVFGLAFLGSGFILSKLLHAVADQMIGADIPILDRMAGALLGVTRIGLVAMTIVMIFDRLVPAHAQPSYLADSRLRPLFSQAAAAGLRKLPPELATTIDRLKRDYASQSRFL